MSRHTCTTQDGGHLAYGFDNPSIGSPGYFVEKYDEDGDIEEGVETRKMFIMRDEVEHGSRADVLEMMEEYGASREHCHKVAGDLPI